MTGELEELVERAQKGDKNAFGQIYHLFLKSVFRFIYFSVGKRELAEDLTQNTFLKAYLALSSFSPARGSFPTYLFTIARNLVIDYYRRKKTVSLEELGEAAEYSLWEDPMEHIFQDEAKQQVTWALAQLDEGERQLVILRYFEELAFSEIARIVGKKEGAVRVALHRTLKKLKSYLEEQ